MIATEQNKNIKARGGRISYGKRDPVALLFVSSEEGLVPGEVTECFNTNVAVMRAEAPSRSLPDQLHEFIDRHEGRYCSVQLLPCYPAAVARAASSFAD